MTRTTNALATSVLEEALDALRSDSTGGSIKDFTHRESGSKSETTLSLEIAGATLVVKVMKSTQPFSSTTSTLFPQTTSPVMRNGS